MTLRSAQQMRDHAHAVARAFGVTLMEIDSMQPDEAMAVGMLSAAVCAPITDETTYAVALHELGHLIAPGGAVRDSSTRGNLGLTLHEEEAAWAWARYIALEWTPVMEQCVAAWALSTYQAAQQQQQRHEQKQQKPPTKAINWNDWR